VALLYLDASAVVKLVRREPESPTLVEVVRGAELVSCELLLAEIPRAIHRFGGSEERRLRDRAEQVLAVIAMVPLDEQLLIGAGALGGRSLRTLDAIHLAAALRLAPIDQVVTYDRRQADAARDLGLDVARP
jgi:uncharacterized protein